MKKKLLLGMALVMALGVSAQKRSWSFDEEKYLVKDAQGTTIATGTTLDKGEYTGLDGMTIIASADGKVKLELTKGFKGDKVFSEIATEGGINTGGSKHGFKISNMKKGDVIVMAVASGGTVAADKLRGVDVFEGSNETADASFRCQATDAAQQPRDYSYTMKADGTITVLSEQSVIIYNVEITPAGDPTSLATDEASKAIISIKYFNIAGIQFAEPQSGFNIFKYNYEDGTSEAKRVYVD